MNKYPIVFWIHSPIGFESYCAMKESNPGITMYACTARNMLVENSIFDLGNPGLYQFQSTEQIQSSAQAILDGLEKLVNQHGGYIMVVPQIAQPYIKILIESDYCRGFAYYDEGRACYGEHFRKYLQIKTHRYELRTPPAFSKLAHFLGVDENTLSKRHLQGVEFYEFNHEKYLGCFSFFGNAFAGFNPSPMELPDRKNEKIATENHSLILIGNILGRSKKSIHKGMAERHYENIYNLCRILPKQSLVIKSHPIDTDVFTLEKIAELGAINWDDFCKKNAINPSLEPAFLEFKYYIGQNNSTMLYLQNMGKSNRVTIE